MDIRGESVGWISVESLTGVYHMVVHGVSVHGPVKNYWSSGLRLFAGFVRSLSSLSGL